MSMRTWTCQRVKSGTKCGHLNPGRKRKCEQCGKPRPARKRPAHFAALDEPYETFVLVNGGEHCGICGKVPSEGQNRLSRDHDHATGKPRGLLCWGHNLGLKRFHDNPDELRAAVTYLERST
jgi:hypothetical protein